MLAVEEIALTSCLNDPAVCVYAWDVQTGSSLMTYRADCHVPCAGLSLISGQYLLAAQHDKPFLRAWPVNSQQPLGQSGPRLLCPGRVSHAQANPDNCYVAVSVSEKLHVYQVGSGLLVWTGRRHYQAVSVLRWSHCGNLLVSGGEDGLVTVWSLAQTQRDAEPRHTFADHTLPVTDLKVTSGSRPRLLTVSADRTCKIYDLWSNTLLVSLVFDSVLTSVAVSTLETDVFVGTDKGTILQFSLLSPPRSLEYHLTSEESAPVFSGHSKTVRSLAASVNGDLLMSGSADGSVKLWHIGSRQCLRTLAHKGPVTNAFFAPKPKQMFDNELKPSVVLNSFQTANSEESGSVEVITEQRLSLRDYSTDTQKLLPPRATNSSEDKIKSLQMDIDLLRTINSNLYRFTVDKVIANNNIVPKVSQVTKEPVVTGKRKRNQKGNELASKKNKTTVNVTVPVNNIKENVTVPAKRKRKKKTNNNANVPANSENRNEVGSNASGPVNSLSKNQKKKLKRQQKKKEENNSKPTHNGKNTDGRNIMKLVKLVMGRKKANKKKEKHTQAS